MSNFAKSRSAPAVNVAIAATFQGSPVGRIEANEASWFLCGLQKCISRVCLFVGALIGPLAVANAQTFEPPPAPGAAASYDGIYQWSTGQYLSLHQDGANMIATIYFNKDGNFTFYAPDGKSKLPVTQLDIFDLLSGPLTGQTAKITGTRFHRGCQVGYDFTFNSDASITVTRTSVINTTAADASGISCSAIVGVEPATLKVPIIRFK